MRRSGDFRDEVMEFNFWPSFTDLMLSVILILVIVLFCYISYLAAENVNLRAVKQNQYEVVEAISQAYHVKPTKLDSSANLTRYGVSKDIIIQSEPTLQKISFQENILFHSGDSSLREEGRQILEIVGRVLVHKLANIRELQIQGHADTDGSSESNLKLASERAMNVYQYLEKNVGVDPAKHLISATTFGNYKPVTRSEEDMSYNEDRLALDNSTVAKKQRNRRIELLIFYKVAAK